MKKRWKTAPLPFQGQKRFFVRHFEEALKGYPPNAVYVDLFGGSGLLSHTVKARHPDARVVYNDYDGYSERLAAIPQTNVILQELRALDISVNRKARIIGGDRDRVIEVLKRHDQLGYVDWISLSGSLLFSMNYAKNFEELVRQGFYNRIRTTDYPCSDGYLEGINVVRYDYKQLFNDYRNQEVVFLVDPPYLSTNTSTYNSDDYWKLRDYLDVLDLLHDHSYFYFTSNKSQIVELCEWVETRTDRNANPFRGSQCTTTRNQTTHNTGYTDIMYHLKR